VAFRRGASERGDSGDDALRRHLCLNALRYSIPYISTNPVIGAEHTERWHSDAERRNEGTLVTMLCVVTSI